MLFKADVEDDSAIPDRQEDIRPRFHRTKFNAQKNSDGCNDLVYFFCFFHQLGYKIQYPQFNFESLFPFNEIFEESMDDDDDFDDDSSMEWNLSNYLF